MPLPSECNREGSTICLLHGIINLKRRLKGLLIRVMLRAIRKEKNQGVVQYCWCEKKALPRLKYVQNFSIEHV
ncbi:hypothetical protein VNO78_14659 [Psophocarpus tetragonolobus]|uniref:Uncharacterized protein n=1 Tax=Psophocarpus tetragonolobus TaxID=3891 RepID=A0AAN9XIX7_PSOTE